MYLQCDKCDFKWVSSDESIRHVPDGFDPVCPQCKIHINLNDCRKFFMEKNSVSVASLLPPAKHNALRAETEFRRKIIESITENYDPKKD